MFSWLQDYNTYCYYYCIVIVIATIIATATATVIVKAAFVFTWLQDYNTYWVKQESSKIKITSTQQEQVGEKVNFYTVSRNF